MSAARPVGAYTYQRHQPEQTILYKIVQENLETFLRLVHEECGRRMSESAIHLVEEVLPIKPIRQWVISFPIQIRLLLAVRPKIMSEVLNVVTGTISGHLCKKAGFKKSQAKAGVVSLIQRFGGSINLNVHFHQLYVDGVYELDEEGRPNAWHMTKVLNKIILRITKLLEKRGIIRRDEDDHKGSHDQNRARE